ncbi:MAG: CO dehydrogenase/CO-methylating acetyl-CoA synthase complex subunit beta [Lachnospiraceae bacterium]|uniref:CO dehydrogenase/CO-methylating acetyl-CoA synthase complex subunit beta n=1 Tax=Hominisplanchenecus murintestinalis TaxID=2941517 RepID=A0AC61R2J7_9FIRM|nr:acetyl-CoA decarbonylase/synthase complex subunit alpha/beta [Hominisplanchenecus murintestinalis]MCI9516135.1 CO dehydrogenase/CO-methylating acetyl-CoA synthase complex subunit beta [Lachnospiraceae bacterium]RKJ97788.1 CO dehydrogenase/CO-methylating acetyl-CoA synthase complex subunit beta [Anaerotruncus sp. 1XD22-93]MCI9660426.1 CO dehydrogenase/CO-methylating acetyl-CoA synthase complex subunit beta [Lachnospiraceae bacterium]NBH97302.1 CO dehydrogenase/CO-methylating acetyl-CoA syntha
MTLFDVVFSGNDTVYGLTEGAINGAIEKHGADKAIAFPNTAYSLPCYYGVTGTKVATLGELKDALGVVKSLMTREKRLNDAFMSGVATALCAEFIEVLKYMDGAVPYEEPCYGHLADAVIRELGVPLVTGDIPGVAVILGSAPTAQEGVELVKSYQAQGILVTLVGGIIDQCEEMGYKTGANVRVIPLGKDVTSVIHVVSVAVRAALIFGNIQPGDAAGLMKYTFERVPAFVNAFAPLDPVIVACGAGAIALGFPVITNEETFRVPKSLIVQKDVSKFNATSLEARDIKIKITNIDIPVAFASAFEGEIIRRGDMQVEFDGSRVDCCELVHAKEASEIEDHKIEVIGPDIDEMEVGSKNSIAYVVEVAGKNMQADFEPVFERKFHSYLNCIEGVMHTGQRDMIRIRISKDAFAAGFRAKHIGEVLYAKVKSEFAAVVDKCQVKIYTDPAECTKIRHEVATPMFDKRDERLMTLTDEGVEVYYSCIMCQAFSPSHVCVVTPERLGLCGAVSWLDAKATHQLDPEGPCQVITKERIIDERIGEYEDVNEAVRKFSQGALEDVSLYSIIEKPMTSCGCFECICGIEPLSNGVCIANREYAGMTPIGMTFPELASMTGGGVQTPGFMGHGKHFIASKKFMKAEGGVARIVWMPKDLKDQVAERLNETAKEMYGIENFVDMIGDETVAEDPETLLAFLEEKGHPALSMEPMM